MPARKPEVVADPVSALGEELASWEPDELQAWLAHRDPADLPVIEHALGLATGANEDRYFPQAREKQIPPVGDWLVWLVMAGRGAGKTRTGSEWIIDQALGHQATWAVMAPTFGDGRDICFEGRGDLGQPSGILSVLERRGHRDRSNWNRSMGELRIENGSLLKLISADDPDRARGWNFAGGWADELGSWPYPDAFDQLRFALRVGDMPRLIVTTTPRPTILIRGLVEQARETDNVHVTRGSTWENRDNLSAPALAELERRYGGTRLGRQELEGELLDDIEGALWKAENILHVAEHPKLTRIMVGIDPSTWGADTGAQHQTVGRGIETGIVVAGIVDAQSPKCYVLQDLSGRYSPDEWATIAVDAWRRWSKVAQTQIVPETNAGGGMVTATIRLVDPSARIYSEKGRSGVHAAQGKRARAEPVAGLYEQHRCEHVGMFETLETQMKEWDSSMPWSPDRVDALVWAITALKPWANGTTTTVSPPTRTVNKPRPGQRATVTRIGRPRSGR